MNPEKRALMRNKDETAAAHGSRTKPYRKAPDSRIERTTTIQEQKKGRTLHVVHRYQTDDRDADRPGVGQPAIYHNARRGREGAAKMEGRVPKQATILTSSS